MDEFRRMRTDLTLVLALVAAIDKLDLKTPIVRILELDGVPGIAGVSVLSHRQQVHLLPVVLTP